MRSKKLITKRDLRRFYKVQEAFWNAVTVIQERTGVDIVLGLPEGHILYESMGNMSIVLMELQGELEEAYKTKLLVPIT